MNPFKTCRLASLSRLEVKLARQVMIFQNLHGLELGINDPRLNLLLKFES